MNTCKTCKHWDRSDRARKLTISAKLNACELMHSHAAIGIGSEGNVAFADKGHVWTGPDFSCCRWESKA